MVPGARKSSCAQGREIQPRPVVILWLATPTAHPLGGRFSDANSCRPPPRRPILRCQLLPPTPSEADSPMPTPAAHPLGGRFSDANSCRPPLRRWFRGCQLAPPTSETAASGFSVYRRPSPRPARYGCRIRLSTSSEAGTAERTSMTLASTSGDSAAALRASGFLRDSQESGVTILERCSRTAPVAVLRPGFPGFLVWLAVASASASSGRPSRFSSIAREAWLHEAMVGMQDYKSKEEGRDP
jgi:hypothetical protein